MPQSRAAVQGARQRQLKLRAVFEALPEQDRYCLHLRGGTAIPGYCFQHPWHFIGLSGAVSGSIARRNFTT